MNPRKSLAKRQEIAQGFACDLFAFASPKRLRNGGFTFAKASIARLIGQVCYPFPSPGPDPFRVGSFFWAFGPGARRQYLARVSADRVFQFAFRQDVVDSSLRTTTQRGSIKCANPFFFSSSLPCRWLAACKTRLRVALPVLLQARRLLTLPTTAPSRVPSSVALLVPQLAASTSVWRLATDLAAAPAAILFTASRGSPLAGRLHFCAPVSIIRARAT